MNRPLMALLSVLLILLPVPVLSRDEGTPEAVIELTNGSFLPGAVLQRDGAGVLVRLEGGSIQLLAPGEVREAHRSGPPAPEFIRFHQGGASGDALQCAVALYLHPETMRRVSLVGAVHVADETYYDQLQALLDAHDLVLFEGVGGEDVREEDIRKLDGLTRMQHEMGRLLALTFQKDGIDYSREHFRNADLDLRSVQKELSDRNQTLVPFQGVINRLATRRPSDPDQDSGAEGPSSPPPGASAEMKRVFGRLLADAPRILAQVGMHDPEKRSDVLISMRNDAAFRFLEEALGEDHRTIAVFYGAAHLPDMHRLLTEKLGFDYHAHFWMDAWDIPASPVLTR